MKKKILVVVDYQKDFVNGSLGFPGAEKLEEPILRKIKEYRNEGQEVLYTADTHEKNYLVTMEGRNLPVVHCVKGTEGWELFGRVGTEKVEEEKVIVKGAFGSLELGEYLRVGQYELVELCGLVSNICVLSNAVIAKAALPEAMVVVDAGCTASPDEKINRECMDILEGIQVQVTGR